MLTKLEIYNNPNPMLSIPLNDPSGGFIVNDISGLDPGKAVLTFAEYAKIAGSTFMASRRTARNIMLDIGMNPEWGIQSISELRARLYQMMMPETPIVFRFFEDTGLTVRIPGRVESFDSPRFAKEPKALVSVICAQPDFEALTPIVIQAASTALAAGSGETSYLYEGNIDTGMIVRIAFNRTVSSFIFSFRMPDGVLRNMSFTTTSSFVNGDILEFNTNPGIKEVIRTRSGTRSSVLPYMKVSSTWARIEPGMNTFKLFATGSAIPFTITYTNKYGGL